MEFLFHLETSTRYIETRFRTVHMISLCLKDDIYTYLYIHVLISMYMSFKSLQKNIQETHTEGKMEKRHREDNLHVYYAFWTI